MSQTIYTGAGAIEYVTATIVASTDIHLDVVQLSVGHYDVPGAWVTPNSLTFSTDGKTATAKLLIGPGYINPAAGSYWLWYRVVDTPTIKIQPIRATKFTTTDGAGTAVPTALPTVASFAGRTGAVVPLAGDYTATQITGADTPALRDAAVAVETARATAAESANSTAIAGKQPLDSDLTAIAALSTTAFGRALLALVDAAAARAVLALGTAATADKVAAGSVGVLDATDAALTAQRAPSDVTNWATGTVYAKGQFVLSPVGAYVAGQRTLIQALANFTSGATFTASNWQRITEQLSPDDLRPGGASDLWGEGWRVKGASRWRAMFTAGTGPTGIVTGRQTYMPIELSEPMTVDYWGIQVTTAGVGGTQTIALGLYAADPTTRLPSGSPILGLSTTAMDLTGGVVGLRSQAFASPITIPTGRYWLAVYTTSGGTVTTGAAIAYLTGQDSRLTAVNGPLSYAYSTGLYEVPPASPLSTVGALANTTVFGYGVLLRQTG